MQNPSPQAVNPHRVLDELARRWRSAYGLEYRSEIIVDHQKDFRAVIQTHVWLRRPLQARLVFRCATFPEADRVRVCDGRQIFDRQITPRRAGSDTAQRTGLRSRNSVTQDLSHPLDEASYSINQFFSAAPWLPFPFWNGAPDKLVVTGTRFRQAATRLEAARDVFEIVFQKGTSRDTLRLDAVSYAPQLLVRVGEHAGVVQELLRETFLLARLNPPLSDALFRWSSDDALGRVRNEAF